MDVIWRQCSLAMIHIEHLTQCDALPSLIRYSKIKFHFLIRFTQPKITLLISFNSGQEIKYFIVSFVILAYKFTYIINTKFQCQS